MITEEMFCNQLKIHSELLGISRQLYVSGFDAERLALRTLHVTMDNLLDSLADIMGIRASIDGYTTISWWLEQCGKSSARKTITHPDGSKHVIKNVAKLYDYIVNVELPLQKEKDRNERI